MSTSIFFSQQREIHRLGVRTPLIVPSFSSRGFPEVGQILHLLRDDLYGICLVSAFDIARQHVQIDFPDIADTLIIDSGVYETSSTIVTNNLHRHPVADVQWTREEYRALLSQITAATNALMVNFDHYGTLQEQIELARADFAHASTVATDFLLKPDLPGDQINIPALLDYVEEFARFDVIGVTEKELGPSLVERCRVLRALRHGLNAKGINCPIHVFGSITPGVIILQRRVART